MDKDKSESKNGINAWMDKTFSPKGKKVFIATCVILIAGVVLCVVSNTTSSILNLALNNKKPNEVVVVEENFNVNNENEPTEEIDIKIEDVDDTMVSVPVEDLGRANPFLPSNESSISVRNSSINGYSLMAPPVGLEEGSDASRVITTKVSGILYDATSPSAILNIEGKDYLVKVGDYINSYKVLSISKDLVTVQLGKNVYKAGVGQAMSDVPLNYNTVYNLQNRFGGAKK